jgi:methylglutamate dehydrogenase subunit D
MLTGQVGPDATAPGVLMTASNTREIASIQLRPGQWQQLAARMAAHFGIALVDAPTRAEGQNIAVLGLGPGAWLATSSGGRDGLAVQLRAVLAESASVTELSAAYALLRVTGAQVRDMLAKLFPIDLHPRVFGVGGVVRSVAAHVTVLLWRLEDQGAHSVFELAVPRSSTDSLHCALSLSAAEFGFESDVQTLS